MWLSKEQITEQRLSNGNTMEEKINYSIYVTLITLPLNPHRMIDLKRIYFKYLDKKFVKNIDSLIIINWFEESWMMIYYSNMLTKFS